jgi:hypothetical protein
VSSTSSTSSITSMPPVAGWAVTHAALRDALLQRIEAVLGSDDRFAGAWLSGSFGRGEQDAYSDVDLVVAVASPHAETLCARPWNGAARTTPERLELIRRLGTPVIVHDAHRNAPEGGTHTNVAFEDGTHLDLNLIPVDLAERPPDARVLFEKRPIPSGPAPEAESLEYRREKAAQIVALFWIMTVTTAKYRRRGWDVNVHMMFDALRRQIEEVRRLMAGEPPRFRRYAPSILLAATPAAQVAALRALCDEMESLAPAVARFSGEVPPAPHTQLERWLTDP